MSNASLPVKKERGVSKVPPGHKVLQLNVPEQTFNLTKAKALILDVPWDQFIIGLLEEGTKDLKEKLPALQS